MKLRTKLLAGGLFGSSVQRHEHKDDLLLQENAFPTCLQQILTADVIPTVRGNNKLNYQKSMEANNTAF